MCVSFRRWLLVDLSASALFVGTFVGIGFWFGKASGDAVDALGVSRVVQIAFAVVTTLWLLAIAWKLIQARRRKNTG
jgi:membrane protein DedA with SNARE-associated domain